MVWLRSDGTSPWYPLTNDSGNLRGVKTPEFAGKSRTEGGACTAALDRIGSPRKSAGRRCVPRLIPHVNALHRRFAAFACCRKVCANSSGKVRSPRDCSAEGLFWPFALSFCGVPVGTNIHATTQSRHTPRQRSSTRSSCHRLAVHCGDPKCNRGQCGDSDFSQSPSQAKSKAGTIRPPIAGADPSEALELSLASPPCQPLGQVRRSVTAARAAVGCRTIGDLVLHRIDRT